MNTMHPNALHPEGNYIASKKLGYLDAYHYKYHAYALRLDVGFEQTNNKQLVIWHNNLHKTR